MTDAAAPPISMPGTDSHPRRRTAALMWLMAGVFAMCWDRAIYLHVSIKDAAAKSSLESASWYKMIWLMGTAWPWLAVAAVLAAHDHGTRKRDPWRRAVFVLLTCLLAGLLAEVGKLTLRRHRPGAILPDGTLVDGHYRFRPLLENTLSSSDLGLPSGHASTAIAGACAVILVLGGMVRCRGVRFGMAAWAGAPVLGLAILCACSRVFVGAHFLSDIVLGAGVGVLSTRVIYALDRQMNRGVGVDSFARPRVSEQQSC
jgi:membrane-associated phospholipid phosphatase